MYFEVLQIRDVYLGSGFSPSRIPDPNFFHPGTASKNLSILTPKKWFLSSGKYVLGCSSPDPDPGSLPIPDQAISSSPRTGISENVAGFALPELMIQFLIIRIRI
jgi:hypothetical protein